MLVVRAWCWASSVGTVVTAGRVVAVVGAVVARVVAVARVVGVVAAAAGAVVVGGATVVAVRSVELVGVVEDVTLALVDTGRGGAPAGGQDADGEGGTGEHGQHLAPPAGAHDGRGGGVDLAHGGVLLERGPMATGCRCVRPPSAGGSDGPMVTDGQTRPEGGRAGHPPVRDRAP